MAIQVGYDRLGQIVLGHFFCRVVFLVVVDRQQDYIGTAIFGWRTRFSRHTHLHHTHHHHDRNNTEPSLVHRRHWYCNNWRGKCISDPSLVASEHVLFYKKCYSSLVENLNLGDVDCLKYSLSKGLGIGVVAGGSIMKVPQLLLSESQIACIPRQ